MSDSVVQPPGGGGRVAAGGRGATGGPVATGSRVATGPRVATGSPVATAARVPVGSTRDVRPASAGGTPRRTAAQGRAAALDRTLAALADPHRRALIDLLGNNALRPSDVADRLAISRPALSRHLRVLRQAGIVAQALLDADARARPVRLVSAPLSELRRWLESVEAFRDGR